MQVLPMSCSGGMTFLLSKLCVLKFLTSYRKDSIAMLGLTMKL